MLPHISLEKVLEYLIPYFMYVLSGPYYMFASYPRGNTIYLFYCYIDLNLSSLQCLIYLEVKNQLEEKNSIKQKGKETIATISNFYYINIPCFEDYVCSNLVS